MNVDSASDANEVIRVVIVGGGTAGWMAALYLHHALRGRGAAITLVESPVVASIGVGEATIPSIVEFLRTLDLDEGALMRRCSATFKLAIKFEGWRGPGSSYWHAFGPCGGQLNGLDLFHFWLDRGRTTGDARAYSDYSLHAGLCEARKAAWPFGGTSAVRELGSYAYHLDASALADYLRQLATSAGVKHLYGHVQSVKFDAQGRLASLDIGAERSIDGDLFLDATGFRGRLIEGEFGDPWIDWSQQLLCDGAVTMPLARDETFPPYTLSCAAPAGWTWRIPLQSRVGVGYVYSRAHISDDEAAATLIARSAPANRRAADPRALKIRIGRRSRFWIANCVSIGLASGFVEPLESTGLHLTFAALKLLVEHWPDRNFAAAGIAAFNSQMSALYDEVRDFIMLHYVLSNRQEPFWRAARMAPVESSLQQLIALHDEAGRVRLGARPVFYEPSYHFIFSGNGRLPRRSPIGVDLARPSEVARVLDQIRAQNERFAEAAPSHADYLAELGRATL